MKELRIHNVRRHETSVKEHRKKHKECDRISTFETRACKRIRQAYRHAYIADRTNCRDKEGNAIRAQNRFSCFKDIRISIRAEFFRKEGITVQHKCLFIREGCHQQEQERKQAHQR